MDVFVEKRCENAKSSSTMTLIYNIHKTFSVNKLIQSNIKN